MVLGVFITFRVLDFPDLTVDGSLPLGAAVTASVITRRSSPVWPPLAAPSPASAPGFVTGLLHLLLKSGDSKSTNYGPKLLAGILTMTGLYTVNLRIMGGATCPCSAWRSSSTRSGPVLGRHMSGWCLIVALAVPGDR